MIDSPELADMLQSMEQNTTPNDEYHYYILLVDLVRRVQEQSGCTPDDIRFEVIAFQIHSHDHQHPSNWGLYFGPMMSGSSQSGEAWEAPSLSAITTDALLYWGNRARNCIHPVMRARYADLLWELPKALDFMRPDADMARIAVDSYLEAVETRRYKYSTTLVSRVQRALTIALSLRDNRRAHRAKDVMLALENSIAEDDSLGLWGFCFDTFVEPPHKAVDVGRAETDRLVKSMEERLGRLVSAPPSEYHPSGAEGAALRLANYYRRLGRKEDLRRVLREYGDVVRRMQGTAAPLVVAHCLEELYGHFKAFEMSEDANALNEAIRTASKESLADMKPIEAKVEISNEKIEEYFAAMLAGTPEDVLTRLTLHFIPNRAETEDQVKRLALQAPISYLMTHTIVDAEGRTLAVVGPLEQDLEGHVIRQLSQNMHLGIPWLRETFYRGLTGSILSSGGLLNRVLASPLFDSSRHVLLEAGFEAYSQSNAFAAVHILIPQVEQATRRLGQLVGAPIYAPRRGGGLHMRTLDDLLRDQTITAVLGEDISTYFRVLLTDSRGWNLRNNVCHGLSPAAGLGMPVADRVVHALLTLALFREQNSCSP